MTTWEQAPPPAKEFLCSEAFHLKNSGFALAIYVKIGQITSGGKDSYFATIAKMSRYFYPEATGKKSRSAYEATRRCFKMLRKLGWLELVERKGKDVHRYVDHEEWAAKHPDSCRKRALLPWEGNADPLLSRLYAASGGRLRMTERNLLDLRRYCSDDAEIEELYLRAIARSNEARLHGRFAPSPRSCLWEVIKLLKNRSKTASVSTAVSVVENAT